MTRQASLPFSTVDRHQPRRSAVAGHCGKPTQCQQVIAWMLSLGGEIQTYQYHHSHLAAIFRSRKSNINAGRNEYQGKHYRIDDKPVAGTHWKQYFLVEI